MTAVKDFVADVLAAVKNDPKHFGAVAVIALVVGFVAGKLA